MSSKLIITTHENKMIKTWISMLSFSVPQKLIKSTNRKIYLTFDHKTNISLMHLMNWAIWLRMWYDFERYNQQNGMRHKYNFERKWTGQYCMNLHFNGLRLTWANTTNVKNPNPNKQKINLNRNKIKTKKKIHWLWHCVKIHLFVLGDIPMYKKKLKLRNMSLHSTT